MGTGGRVALITGAATGIGHAIASRLGRAGYDVAVADIDAPGAEATAKRLREGGRRAAAIRCDVRDRAAVLRAVDEATRAVG
jgi:NAD(P)-dependent dehydrogenase (short-subunit alcohol dehydrogenase family)